MFGITLTVVMFVMGLLMVYSYLVIFPRYESHWRATEHEFTSLWTHVNSLEYTGKIEEMEEFFRKEGLEADE